MSAELRLASAIREWRHVLGTEHVWTDTRRLATLQSATYRTPHRIPAVLRPANTEQVVECLRIASHHGVPVHPISTGKNWGYGSATATHDNCVLLMLSRLNRIINFDERLAYVTVEPGVTQRQLYDFLRSRNTNLVASVTGSSPESSLIGNVLERGLGEGPLGDRFAHVCGLEVVLSTGELVRTGFTRHQAATTGEVHRWGLGPWLDGLFTQSNLGVVTRMTLWLTPLPEHSQVFRFSLNQPVDQISFIDGIRRLRLTGVLSGGFIVANDIRLLAERQRYPWRECGGLTPLPEAIRSRLRELHGLGSWNGEGALYPVNAAHARVLQDIISATFSPVVDHLEFLPATVGMPVEDHLAMTYWRKRTPPPRHDLDPDRDRCGLIWVCPVVPLEPRHVSAVIDTVERETRECGFESNLSLNSIADRSLVLTAAIVYDRDILGEDDRALRCYQLLLRRLIEQGYPPYRISTASMAEYPKVTDNSPAVLRRIKRALDPRDILSPGRYDLRSQWPAPLMPSVHSATIQEVP